MSEIKRAQLIPFATQKDNEKPLKETKKTVRISVVLPESNEHTCPEYNYKDELAAAKKLGKYKESNGANGLLRPIDLDEDDDDDVRRIAKQMEEKYGTGVSLNKKKRKGRKDDYADIGMGYDESDSFIDNTDGYDEMIPQNVTTLHGGFYINSGALEFKTDDEANSDFSSSSSSDEDDNDNENDDEDDDEDNNEENDNNDENNKVKPTNRKRVIESSDETDRENKTDVDNLNQLQKKRKLQNGGNGMQQSIKKKLFNSNKIYVKKRRLVDQQKKTVKELLREKREDLNMSVPGSANTSIIVNADNNTDKEIKPIITPPTITTTNGSVDNVIESVVKASTKDIEITRKSPINVNNTANIVTTISTSLMTTTATTTATTTNSTTTPPPPSSSPATIITPIKESSHDTHKVDVKLPENLPSDIVAIITTIQQLLIKYQNDIKHNDVNRMILRLERKSKCLGKPSKIKVYEYLANFANCKTEILIQRAKNLILDDEQKKLKTILSELKVEIDKIMPSLLENHDKESQRILQKKFSSESVDSEDNKSLRMPKRRFIWNDTTKKLLKDILMLKKRCLLLEGKHKETLDTRMLSFLKNDIQTLWPDGWMSMNALNKIYTTYADPKRLLNNTQPTNLTTTTTTQNDTSTTITATATTTTSITSTTTNIKSSLKNLPHSLSNNSNLSITPVIPATKDNKNVNNNSNSVDVRNSDTMNLSRTLPEKSHCDKVESRLKVKSPSELMMKPSNHINNNNSVKKLIEADITNDDSVIIIDRVSPIKDRTLNNNNNNNSSSSTNNKTDHNYQVIDLSDKNELKKSNDLISKHNLNKHHEISITPNYNSTTIAMETTTTTTVTTTTTTKTIDTTTKSNCDDIQKVMEDLKALQKLSSSPKKSLIDNNIKSSSSSPSSANSSAVSVIAVNKSFTPKTSHNHHHHHQQHHHHSHHQQQQPHHSTMQRIDYVKNSDFGGGSSFQGEFQKQFLNVLNQLKPTTTTTTNKNNYNSIDTFPHIASGSGMVTNDKYYQTSSNYNQGPNGHKTTPTTSTQSGTYNIIDDMFASFLTQYGYPKEATAPKSQPK